ncbi:MAG: hypothetical protein Fur0037_00890 [Planctomycetota bacterium]
MDALKRLLFPQRPRVLAGRRAMKIALRAAHVLCATLFVGACAFTATEDARAACLAAAMGSGLLLLSLDFHESAACLLQVRGAVLAGKLAALAAFELAERGQPWILFAIVLFSVVSSHAPGAVRYHLLWMRGKITPTDSKG